MIAFVIFCALAVSGVSAFGVCRREQKEIDRSEAAYKKRQEQGWG